MTRCHRPSLKEAGEPLNRLSSTTFAGVTVTLPFAVVLGEPPEFPENGTSSIGHIGRRSPDLIYTKKMKRKATEELTEVTKKARYGYKHLILYHLVNESPQPEDWDKASKKMFVERGTPYHLSKDKFLWQGYDAPTQFVNRFVAPSSRSLALDEMGNFSSSVLQFLRASLDSENAENETWLWYSGCANSPISFLEWNEDAREWELKVILTPEDLPYGWWDFEVPKLPGTIIEAVKFGEETIMKYFFAFDYTRDEWLRLLKHKAEWA